MSEKQKQSLHFETPVLAVGGGQVVGAALLELGARLPIIGVDSGADRVIESGLMPRWVVGDLDSFQSHSLIADGCIIEMREQSETDCAKMLAITQAPLIIGLGFLGARFDHSLASINALAAHAKTPTVLLSANDTVFSARTAITLNLAYGDRISIWPLAGQGFTASTGLEWPLDGLFLKPDGMISISNRVAAKDGTVSITPETGGSEAGGLEERGSEAGGPEERGKGFLVIIPNTRWKAAAQSLAPESAVLLP